MLSYFLPTLAIGLSLIILWRIRKMEDTIQALADAVAAEKTVEDSAVALLTGISARIDAAVADAEAGDTAKLQALAGEIKDNTAALATAVSSGTPAAPAA